MLEYSPIDTDFLLTVGVVTTFGLLAVSLVRMLSSVNPLRSVSIILPWHRPAAARWGATAAPSARIAESTDGDLARLDDDGGGLQRVPDVRDTLDGARPLSDDRMTLPTQPDRTPPMRDGRFKAPMIPGAREAGVLTTFGVPAVILPHSPTTMDAATIAARQREGGGAPSERRGPRPGSMWQRLVRLVIHD
jgi:hypothetical protein